VEEVGGWPDSYTLQAIGQKNPPWMRAGWRWTRQRSRSIIADAAMALAGGVRGAAIDVITDLSYFAVA